MHRLREPGHPCGGWHPRSRGRRHDTHAVRGDAHRRGRRDGRRPEDRAGAGEVRDAGRLGVTAGEGQQHLQLPKVHAHGQHQAGGRCDRAQQGREHTHKRARDRRNGGADDKGHPGGRDRAHRDNPHEEELAVGAESKGDDKHSPEAAARRGRACGGDGGGQPEGAGELPERDALHELRGQAPRRDLGRVGLVLPVALRVRRGIRLLRVWSLHAPRVHKDGSLVQSERIH